MVIFNIASIRLPDKEIPTQELPSSCLYRDPEVGWLCLTKRTKHNNITLASRGLEEPAHASRGLEEPFFQLCCCVSFWFWREIEFGCTYYYVLGVPYSCGVVLVFFVLAGNSFWCYVVRIRMIDGTHTNSYVVTHMYHFVASGGSYRQT